MSLDPSAKAYEWAFRRVVWATLIVVAVALSFWLLYRFNQVVFIVFVAMVMGTVMRPAAAWLQRLGLPRTAGSFLPTSCYLPWSSVSCCCCFR